MFWRIVFHALHRNIMQHTHTHTLIFLHWALEEKQQYEAFSGKLHLHKSVSVCVCVSGSFCYAEYLHLTTHLHMLDRTDVKHISLFPFIIISQLTEHKVCVSRNEKSPIYSEILSKWNVSSKTCFLWMIVLNKFSILLDF